MPNCFNLTPIGANSPEKLADIDEKICKHLGVPCDPVKYYNGWYDWIGFLLAMGKSFDQIREKPETQEDPTMVKIVDFLKANYTSDSWAEIGRR